MGQLYDKEKDEDGFLYVAYSGENTFGFWAWLPAQMPPRPFLSLSPSFSAQYPWFYFPVLECRHFQESSKEESANDT